MKETYLYQCLIELINENGYKKISTFLNVSIGTVKRWMELKSVPKAYYFEIMKLSNIDIDYSKFTFKEKDQFFTPVNTAQYCYSKCIEIIKEYEKNEAEYTYIEPSAGNGNFFNLLPENRRIGLDIEPRNDTHNEILKHNYLYWKPDNNKKYIVIGNPPFGLRGHLALKFINHSYDFADYVCFILPQLFESDGKGVPRKRVKLFNLIHSEKLNTHFEEPDGKKIKIECIFQIWSKKYYNDKYKIKKDRLNTSIMKIYSLSDGGTSSTTRNKNMFYNCDIYIPSTCFGKENMKCYNNFDELPGKRGYGVVFYKNKNKNIKKFKDIIWYDKAFLSTNSAYNIRSSQISSLFD